ncbi:MAG: hypothetical protein KF777_00925 [Planctomycetaceae bacterium]|nr:hypothetical protein [Planctomycetaceae bacterium]
MTIRAIAVLAIISLCGTDLLAKQNVPGNGERIVLQLSGNLAKEYGRRTGASQNVLNDPGLRIEIVATVVLALADGQVRIEHSCPVGENGKLARLITLMATVSPDKITSSETPSGTIVFASPGDGASQTLTVAASRIFRTELSDLKGVTLRTWSLVEEIGK